MNAGMVVTDRLLANKTQRRGNARLFLFSKSLINIISFSKGDIMIREVQNGTYKPGDNSRSHYGNTVDGNTYNNMAHKANLWDGWSKRVWSTERKQWVFWSPNDGVWYHRKFPDSGGARVMIPLDNRVDPNWQGGTDVFVVNGPNGNLPVDNAVLRITRVNNAPVVLGQSFQITVVNDRGLSIDGLIVVFGSTDPLTRMPGPAYFGILNTQTANITFRTAGQQTITISNGINSATLTVNVLTPNLVVTGTNNGTALTTNAGQNITLTVTKMNNGAVDANYRGTVTFRSTDGDAVLPAQYQYQAGDNGVKAFNNVQLKRIYGSVPTQTITVTDTDGNIGSITYTIIPGVATGISISAQIIGNDLVQDIQTSGVAFPVRVNAFDAHSNIAPTWRGTVRFTSNDNNAVLPGNYQFTAQDAGTHTFNVTLATVRENVSTITVADAAANNPLPGDDTYVINVRGVCASIEVTLPATYFQNSVIPLTLRTRDSNNRLTPNYSGTLRCTKSNNDPDDQFVAQFPFVPRTIGFGGGISRGMQYTVSFHSNGVITFTDIANNAITGNTNVSLSV
jgi:hypothetical protein